MKKALSLLLCAVILLGMMSVTAFAADVDDAATAVSDEKVDTGAENAQRHSKDLAETGAPADVTESGYSVFNQDFYGIIVGYNGNYLEADTSNNDNVVLAAKAARNTQIWYFQRTGNGYKIRNKGNNQYLEVQGKTAENHSNIWTNYNSSTDAQIWYLNKTDDNYFQFLTALNTSYDMEAENFDSTPSNVELYTNKTYTYSKFKIYLYEETQEPTITLGTPNFKLENVYGGVKVSWNAVSGADKYRVQRYDDYYGWETLVNTRYLHYTDTSAYSGNTYKYRVFCVTPGQSNYYTKSIYYIAAPVVKVSNTNKGPTVKWSSVYGATYYRVFIKKSGKWAKLGDTSSTSLLHKKFKYNTKYTYTVRCLSPDKKRFISGFNTKGVTNKIVKTPKMSFKIRQTSVKLSWKKIKGAAKYRLYWRAPGGSWNKMAETTSTSYIDNEVYSNKGYYYTVRVITAKGVVISGYKSTKLCTFYKAPKLTNASTFTNGYRYLRWEPITGVYRYKVMVWIGRKWKTLAITSNNYLTYRMAGGEYQNRCYAIRCVNYSGKNISTYYENVLSYPYIYAYLPNKYTSTHRYTY